MREEHDEVIPEHFYLNPYKPPDGDVIYPPLDRTVFKKALIDYYVEAGWNVRTGLPKKTKLEDLDLQDVASEFCKLGLIQ